MGKPSIVIDRSIANSSAVNRKYFEFNKKLIEIERYYGRSYLIYLIIGIQIGANFIGDSCKLCFKTIIAWNHFPKKNTHTAKKSLFVDVLKKLP